MIPPLICDSFEWFQPGHIHSIVIYWHTVPCLLKHMKATSPQPGSAFPWGCQHWLQLRPHTYSITVIEMLTFWWNFHHKLHWKLSFRQLPVELVKKKLIDMMTFPFQWWPIHMHGFHWLYFVVVVFSFLADKCDTCAHISQGCFTGSGAIIWLPQCQWSNREENG